MSDKASTGCLGIIVTGAVFMFLARYIPPTYIMFGFIGLWALTSYLNRDAIRAKKEAEARDQREEEAERIKHRDADSQTSAYEYSCVGHPNNTLAIRYGIANLERNENGRFVPSNLIALRKLEKLKEHHYLAVLPDYGNRRVRVVIEPGTEEVKTFYPLDDDWFHKHADIERTLKDNKTFTLKQLAMLHAQKVIKPA